LTGNSGPSQDSDGDLKTNTDVGTVGWQDVLDDYDDADWLSVSPKVS